MGIKFVIDIYDINYKMIHVVVYIHNEPNYHC